MSEEPKPTAPVTPEPVTLEPVAPAPVAPAPVAEEPPRDTEVKPAVLTPSETLNLAAVAQRAATALLRADGSFVVAVVGLIVAVVSVGATVYLGVVQNNLAQEQNNLAQEQTKLAREQTKLAEGQNSLAQRQLDLMVKQDEIFERRAVLTMSVTKVGPDDYALVVNNTGKRTAQDFYYTIRFDSFLMKGYGTSGSVQCSSREDEPKAMVLTGQASGNPLYPTRTIEIGSVSFWKTRATTIEWQIVSEDGAFPTKQSDTIERSTGTFGRIEVSNNTGRPRPDDTKDRCG